MEALSMVRNIQSFVLKIRYKTSYNIIGIDIDSPHVYVEYASYGFEIKYAYSDFVKYYFREEKDSYEICNGKTKKILGHIDKKDNKKQIESLINHLDPNIHLPFDYDIIKPYYRIKYSKNGKNEFLTFKEADKRFPEYMEYIEQCVIDNELIQPHKKLVKSARNL